MQPKRTISSAPKPKNCCRRSSTAAESSSSNISKRDELRCWFLRNNSQNVTKLLAPYIYEMGLDQGEFGVERDGSKRQTSSLTCDMALRNGICSECYCNEDPVLPRLNPKKFLNEEDYPNHLYDSCEDESKESPGGDKNWNDHFTNRRSNYEYRNLCGDYPDGRMERPIRANHCYQCGDSFTIQTKPTSGITQNGAQNGTPKEVLDQLALIDRLQKASEQPRNLEIISKFRNEQFFDCHSSAGASNTSIPPHKCIHKFTVNERLYPEPMNSDPFGTSRCIICNLPMKTICDLHKKYVNPRSKTKKTASKNVEPLSKLYDPTLAPRKVNISCGCEDIELIVPKNVKKKEKTVYQMYEDMKRHTPKDTLALRFQKGVTK